MKTPLIRGRSIAVVGYQRVKFKYIILTLGHLASFFGNKALARRSGIVWWWVSTQFDTCFWDPDALLSFWCCFLSIKRLGLALAPLLQQCVIALKLGLQVLSVLAVVVSFHTYSATMLSVIFTPEGGVFGTEEMAPNQSLCRFRHAICQSLKWQRKV